MATPPQKKAPKRQRLVDTHVFETVGDVFHIPALAIGAKSVVITATYEF